MIDGSASLLSFLQSLHAVYSVPLPVRDRSLLREMDTLIVMDLESRETYIEAHAAPSYMFQPPSSFFYHECVKPHFEALSSVLDPALYAHVFRNCSLYIRCDKNRWLQISDSSEARGRVEFFSKTCNTRKKRIVHKVECMYRTNWNRKYPLGVSNVFHSTEVECPEAFAQQLKLSNKFSNILWSIKANCSKLSSLENLLGISCPLPALGGLEELKSLSPQFVFRNVSAVPSLTVSAEKAAWLVSKLLRHLLPDAVFRSGVAWRTLIKKYLELPRHETLSVPRGLDPDLTLVIFKKIIVPLVSYLFYATEFETDTVVLFRRPVWDVVVSKCSQALVELLGLQKTPEKNSSAGFRSCVRWIPKKTGFRPLVKYPKHVKEKTKRLLRYLTALRYAESGRMGHSVFSRDELGEFLKKFIGLGKFAPHNRENHFFSADVQNCFESIPLQGLRIALEDFASPSLRFSSLMVSWGRLHACTPRRKKPIVFLRHDIPNLLVQLPVSSDPNRPVVIEAELSSFAHERMQYSQVVFEILKIVSANVYALNTQGSTTSTQLFQVTTHGLPQGSSFSVMLVSIYYGYIDRTLLRLDESCTVLIRLVDDMLCFSTRRDELDRLLYLVAEECIYGRINEKKLRVGTASEIVDWAGFTLSSAQDENRINVSQQAPLKNSNLLLSLRSVPLLFCERINTKKHVRINAHNAGIACGTRIAQWIKENQCSEEEIVSFCAKMKKFAFKRFPAKIEYRQLFRAALLHSLS